MPVILASASPRRREMLRRIFGDFESADPNIDEGSEVLPLEDRATELALAKARACRRSCFLSIGSDTIVGLGDVSFGKPGDQQQSIEMLEHLSGKTHRVITAVGLVWDSGEHALADTTLVTFRHLTQAEIEAYVSGGEPMDKAGGYAIQGGAASFAVSIEGDIDTVIGLPVARLTRALLDLGLAEPMV